MAEKNLATFIQNRLYRHRDRPAYRQWSSEGDHSKTWQEVGQEISAFGAKLAKKNVTQETPVAIDTCDELSWIIRAAAALSLGHKVIVISPTSGHGEIASVATEFGAYAWKDSNNGVEGRTAKERKPFFDALLDVGSGEITGIQFLQRHAPGNGYMTHAALMTKAGKMTTDEELTQPYLPVVMNMDECPHSQFELFLTCLDMGAGLSHFTSINVEALRQMKEVHPTALWMNADRLTELTRIIMMRNEKTPKIVRALFKGLSAQRIREDLGGSVRSVFCLSDEIPSSAQDLFMAANIPVRSAGENHRLTANKPT